MKRMILIVAAVLGGAWLLHHTVSGGAAYDERALAERLVAVVNDRQPDWPNAFPPQSLRRCLSFGTYNLDPVRDEMPATGGPAANGWLLAEQGLLYNEQTAGTYFGSVWHDKRPVSSVIAALLDAQVVVRMPVKWLKFDPGLKPPPNPAPGMTFPTRPPSLMAAQGDLLFGTAPDGFWFSTQPAFPDGQHKPPRMIVGAPSPMPKTADPLGVRVFTGICWRLHAVRVLEIGPIVNEGNGVRSVVAAVLRTPPSVPSWFTDPHVVGVGTRSLDVQTVDVALYRFRDFGGGWQAAFDNTVLRDPGPLHPVGGSW